MKCALVMHSGLVLLKTMGKNSIAFAFGVPGDLLSVPSAHLISAYL